MGYNYHGFSVIIKNYYFCSEWLRYAKHVR